MQHDHVEFGGIDPRVTQLCFALSSKTRTAHLKTFPRPSMDILQTRLQASRATRACRPAQARLAAELVRKNTLSRVVRGQQHRTPPTRICFLVIRLDSPSAAIRSHPHYQSTPAIASANELSAVMPTVHRRSHGRRYRFSLQNDTPLSGAW